ncbi:unnamed protein product [Owenia fusiformis]|uniref:Uncharacterized protein n=1 Tax=Owenia fusiformis TaxID=6347 RepID=A0A8J1UGU7_OWEFU|nr:unnamed protein product [Owenia fusiformis]
MCMQDRCTLTAVLGIVLAVGLCSADKDIYVKKAQQLLETRNNLLHIKDLVGALDGELERIQKKTCAIGGGLSHHCALQGLNDKMQVYDWLKSGLSPGRRRRSIADLFASSDQHVEMKRRKSLCSLKQTRALCDKLETIKKSGANLKSQNKDILSIIDIDPLIRAIETLKNKRSALNILRRLLEDLDEDLMLEQKRNCLFNLGGHCATEKAASVADQWHYLNSAISPGRKRRDTKEPARSSEKSLLSEIAEGLQH